MFSKTPEEICKACGACCREAYHVVEVDPGDPFILGNRDVLVFQEGRWTLPRPSGHCVCLQTMANGEFVCDRYASRPATCIDFEFQSENCAEARLRVGLEPLPG
jgi:hypothetical protein